MNRSGEQSAAPDVAIAPLVRRNVVHKNMNTKIFLAAMLITTILVGNSTGNPSFYWESAQKPASSQEDGFPIIASIQFIGTRLLMGDTIRLQTIGASLYGNSDNSTFFMALISINSLTDLPNGNPFSSEEVVASAIIQAGTQINDYCSAVDVLLEPGYYGIVIASGLYGATGIGGMPNNNIDNMGSSYFHWIDVDPNTTCGNRTFTSDGSWSSGGGGYRFILEGQVVPEPSTILLGLSGGAAILLARKRRPTKLRISSDLE